MEQEIVTCRCGELTLNGIERIVICQKSVQNYCEVDDHDNEINTLTVSTTPNKQELLKMLEVMVKNIDDLPPIALNQPINHYDFSSALVLLLAILRSD